MPALFFSPVESTKRKSLLSAQDDSTTGVSHTDSDQEIPLIDRHSLLLIKNQSRNISQYSNNDEAIIDGQHFWPYHQNTRKSKHN